MRWRAERSAGFIEANVPVQANAKHLYISGTNPVIQRIIARTFFVKISCQAVWHMRIRLVYIHMVKQMLIHKISVAFRVRPAYANVFVKVYALYFGKGYFVGLICFNKLIISAYGRAARCQAQHAVRLCLYFAYQHIGSHAAKFIVILCLNQFHMLKSRIVAQKALYRFFYCQAAHAVQACIRAHFG